VGVVVLGGWGGRDRFFGLWVFLFRGVGVSWEKPGGGGVGLRVLFSVVSVGGEVSLVCWVGAKHRGLRASLRVRTFSRLAVGVTKDSSFQLVCWEAHKKRDLRKVKKKIEGHPAPGIFDIGRCRSVSAAQGGKRSQGDRLSKTGNRKPKSPGRRIHSVGKKKTTSATLPKWPESQGFPPVYYIRPKSKEGRKATEEKGSYQEPNQRPLQEDNDRNQTKKKKRKKKKKKKKKKKEKKKKGRKKKKKKKKKKNEKKIGTLAPVRKKATTAKNIEKKWKTQKGQGRKKEIR